MRRGWTRACLNDVGKIPSERERLTRACLNDDGNIPSERERLTRFVMIGPSSLKQSFRRKVGMESSGHCLFSEEEMSL